MLLLPDACLLRFAASGKADNVKGLFRSYFSDVRRAAGRDLPIAALLVVAGAVLEGIGIVAILPFAALITGNADTDAARSILSFMGGIGIESEFARAMALSGGFLAVLALRGLVVWRRDTKLFQMGLAYVDGWRSTLFRAIANAKWSTVSALQRTDIEHSITNDVMRLSSGTDRMLRGGAAIALAFVQLGIIALLAPKLLILVGVLIGIAVLVTIPLLRKANALGKRLTQSGRKIHRVLGDFLASQKLARLNNAEAQFLDRFDRSVRDARTSQMEFFASQTAARLGFQFAAGCVVVAALLAGFFVLETPISILAVTLLVLARLVAPIQTIAQTGQAVANVLPAYAALQATLETLRSDAEPAAQPIPTLPSTGPAALHLEQVGFCYPGQNAAVLSDVSFAIEAGEIVALSAPSGQGKTTLLDIVSGLHQPSAGAVLVDGAVLSDQLAIRNWRARLAYLPQDPFLFDSTIRENLLWSAAHNSDDDLRDALRSAEIGDFVDALPDGLDTRAGERGQNFSGGERQRLCIARALLRRPAMLILDEATNALDGALESRILANLSALRHQTTLLIVSHRAQTLDHADRVISLTDGQVIAR